MLSKEQLDLAQNIYKTQIAKYEHKHGPRSLTERKIYKMRWNNDRPKREARVLGAIDAALEGGCFACVWVKR
jgi:hypothetical protein